MRFDFRGTALEIQTKLTESSPSPPSCWLGAAGLTGALGNTEQLLNKEGGALGPCAAGALWAPDMGCSHLNFPFQAVNIHLRV